MNNSDKIKAAFDSVVPDEALVDSVLKNDIKVKRRGTAPKKLISVLAACAAVMTIGVTSYSLIDFHAVFGDYVQVDDDLAHSLVGTLSNVSYKVSDDAYCINVIGATGSKKSLIVVAEISRKDGTPVIDHFENVSENKHLANKTFNFEIIGAPSSGGGYDSYLNDKGNIELMLDLSGSDNISGKLVTMEGVNFYPLDKYYTMIQEKQVNVSSSADYVSRETGEPVTVDESGVMGIPLEWELRFRYHASDKAMSSKKSTDTSEPFVLYEYVIDPEAPDGEGEETETECKLISLEINATGGNIVYEFPTAEFDSMRAYHYRNNEIYLIYSDGSRVRMHKSGHSGQPAEDPNYFHIDANLDFVSEDDGEKKQFVNIDDACALEINGVVYELE